MQHVLKKYIMFGYMGWRTPHFGRDYFGFREILPTIDNLYVPACLFFPPIFLFSS